MSVRIKIQSILEHLGKEIYEKEEVIRLALLTALAGESIFLLGPPGVAKSLIARKLKFAFKDGNSFEYLMSRFSTPDEIFGPVSIKKLKDEDRYERLTEKYLPGANIVFLDEIWKAGPSIQNALLTILNEKVYRNGEQEVKVNIRGIISASNEVPSSSEGVEALWDRFLVRYYIREIQSSRNFLKMITSTEDIYQDNIPEEVKISMEEYDSWSQEIEEIQLPPEVLNAIQLVKFKLEQYNQNLGDSEQAIHVYDRRWKKIIRLIRTSAFLNGRQQADLMDCFLIAHCLWSHPEQFDRVMEIVSETIRKHGYTIALNIQTIRQELDDFEKEVHQETRIPNQVLKNELYVQDREYYEIPELRQLFDGFFVKMSDFNRLSREDDNSISLYDAQYNLTNRVNARKADQEFSIEITYNSQTKHYPLKTQQIEKTEIIQKAPHPIIREHWDQRINTLEDYIHTQKERLDTERPEALDTLAENLFVHPKLSEIVEENIRDVRKSLNQLKLRAEKIAFSYQNL